MSGTLTPADLDRMLHVWESHLTGGRSPSTVGSRSKALGSVPEISLQATLTSTP